MGGRDDAVRVDAAVGRGGRAVGPGEQMRTWAALHHWSLSQRASDADQDADGDVGVLDGTALREEEACLPDLN